MPVIRKLSSSINLPVLEPWTRESLLDLFETLSEPKELFEEPEEVALVSEEVKVEDLESPVKE